MSNPNLLKTGHSRVDVADVLRGLSVMGIIVLHCIEHFNGPSYPHAAEQSAWLNFTDRAVWDGLFFVLGGKAYAVFALLFGFSFFIQEDNCRLRGGDFRLRFCWRLVLLFIFGNINAAFYTGEVLVLYSLVGFILPLTCRLSDKKLFVLASLLLVQPLSLYYALRAAIDPAYVAPLISDSQFWAVTKAAQMNGSLLEMVRVNLWEGQLASLAWAWNHGRIFQTAALFLLGMLIGRRGLFRRENLPVWGRVLAGALVAFFPLYGLANMLPDFIENRSILKPLLLTVNSLHKFSFMLILVSGVIFMFYKTRAHDTLMRITPYGRMSLTNYITQSVIGSLLFYNWGFGLYDNICITYSALVGIAIFALQLTFCRWWMHRHAHGPLEWLWKRATWIKIR